MKKILVMFSIAILFIVVGCSPSEKSIEKAVTRGDYQYIEKYLSNSKYWNDPNKSAVNAAAVEGLILLGRIDTAVTLYRENKGKPAEEMIVKAFADALAKSKPQKTPEKLIDLIDDNRNDNSDAILRRTVVEIEPSMGISKTKYYTEKAINERKTSAIDIYTFNLNKALLWDVKGIFADTLNLLMQQYSELEKIAIKERDIKWRIRREEKNVKDKEQPVEEARQNINDLHSGNPYNLVVVGCLQLSKNIAFATSGKLTPYSFCLTELQKKLKEAGDNLNQAKKELNEAIIERKEIEKTIRRVDAKIPEVEAAEAKALESLNKAGQQNISQN